MSDPAQLWQQLQHADLVSGELPVLKQNDQQSAFFMRVLLGVSGWLSALFLIAFMASFFIIFLSETDNIWVLGVILCALSIGVSRIPDIPLFGQQFIFACNLTGQAFIAFGVFDSTDSSQITAAVMLVLEVAVFAAIGIRSQRTVAMFFACCAFLWLLDQHNWLYAMPLLSAVAIALWLNQLRLYTYRAYLQPATTGVTLGLWLTIFVALQANSTELSGWLISKDSWQTQLWIAAILSSLVCLGFAWQLIQQTVQQPKLRYIALFISIAIAALNLKMLGIAPLCLLLCIGVAQAHSRLIAFNLMALALYLILYYYSLNNTLLYKSILLCSSGAVLLVLYALLQRYVSPLVTEYKTHA